jgi:serine/threonine protein kinase/Tfp pilus assembly protein PilF
MVPDDSKLGHGLAPGAEVQGYRILRVLGVGGFGITYLAEHIAIGNRVAIKEFLPAGVAARSIDGVTVRPVSTGAQQDFAWGLERFRQEARTLGRLEHPNIVRVLNFAEANGTAYTMMEFVDGESLGARLLRRRTLSAPEIEALLPDLLAGLAAVHGAGLLHRDIKPDNIILRTNGAPVLIDFGAARQAMGAHSHSLTTVLSEGYAPYEQYDPHGNQGPWTDLYALGGTLYRCITGDKPVPAPRRVDARFKNREDPLAPVAERAQARHAPALLAAVDAALAVLEDERPQSIAAFRALLEQSDAAPEPAAPPPPRERPRRSTLAESRRAPDGTLVAGERPGGGGMRWIVAAVLIVFIAGGAAAGYMLEQRAEERRQEAKVEADRLAAREAERKAEEDARRRAAEEEARRRAEESARKAEEEARRKAEEEARRRAEEEARRGGDALRQAREDARAGQDAVNKKAHDEAIRLLTRAIDSGKLSGQELAAAYTHRGVAWHNKRNLQLAVQDYNEALRHDADHVLAYVNRGVYYLDVKDYDRALVDLNKALELDRNQAHAWGMRGNVWFHKRDYEQAIRDYSESLRLRPNDAQTLTNRGISYETKGDRARAIADYRAALRADSSYQAARDGLKRLGVNE